MSAPSEDVSLFVHEGGLLLAIHAGTRLQRVGLLSALSELAFELLGESITFEER